jgi:thiol-disulfide isomerase/thioredoxin
MMKLYYLLLLPLFIVSCSSDPSFTLSGRISDSGEEFIYLNRRENGEWVTTDSTIITEGQFQFEGRVDYPKEYYLQISGKRGYKMLFLENHFISVSGSADSLYSLKVTGSVTNNEYDLYSNTIDLLLSKKIEILTRQQQALLDGDSVKTRLLREENSSIDKEIVDWKVKFLIENSGSYASPIVLQSLTTDIEPDILESLIEGLDQSLNSTEVIVNLKEYISKRKTLKPGNIASDFDMPDTEGALVSLSDITGEGPVLLYFWASWCANCSEVSESLEEIFAKYSSQGVKIIAVSLDSDRENWLGSIGERSKEWIHLSDLKFWNNSAAKLYGINRIPEVYLLDNSGSIIGSDIIPEEMDEMVKTLIDK